MPAKKLPVSIDSFKELFVHREDIYSVQDAEGTAYHRINRPLDQQTIKDHLLGKQTIGLYQLKDNTVTWAVIDIDINKKVWAKANFKIEDWEDRIKKQACAIKDILDSRGMRGYREFSGFKGEHVWVFFEKPITAGLVKNVFDSLFLHMPMVDPNIHIEIFPKQSRASEFGTGSLVKAPLGKHQRSKKFSRFIDSLEPPIEKVSEKSLKGAINGYDAIFLGCQALRHLKNEGIHSEHLGHEERLAIAYIFSNLGNEGIDYIINQVFSKLNDYDEKKTSYQLRQMVRHKYKPITCKTLQEKGICPGPCTAIGPSKSPIVFYEKQLSHGVEEPEMKSLASWDKYLMEGHNYYEIIPSSPLPIKLSNFVLDLFEQVYIEDGKNEETIFRGHVTNEHGTRNIEMNMVVYTSDEKFSAAIYSRLGNSGTLLESPKKIRAASNKYSQRNMVKIKKIFGYNEELTKYYTPSILVDVDGVHNNNELIITLEGEEQAELLDFKKLDDDEFKEIKKHIEEDLLGLASFEVTHSAFAHSMLPIIEPWVDKDDKSKYSYFLRGQTGTGKSFLMRAMQNFYGHFPEEVVTWASTPLSIQHIGYFFKDCLFLVDDFKRSNISNYSGMLQILQTYADTTARGRLKSSGIQMAKTYHIKGTMALTGEDTPEGEASNLARMLIIEYGSHPRDIPKGGQVKKYKEKYCGFTPRYVQHVLNQDKQEISDTRQKYLEEFFKIIEGQPNDVRIARNIAILMTSYEYLSNFLWNKKKAEINISRLKKYFCNLLVHTMAEAKEEKSSQRFWHHLQEFIAADKLQIVPTAGKFVPASKGAIVGFISAGKTWLIYITAYNEVQRILKQSGDKLNHGYRAVFADLEMDGVIKSSKGEPRTFNGKSVRAIEIEFNKPTLINEPQ